MRVLHLFAGAGGSHLAGELLGWESVGSVEIEPYCRAVIKTHYPNEEIHNDVRTYSAHHLRGVVDGICGGFPCQDISCAGKGAGITGERSGLWKEFSRIIGECRPAWAFIENSPLLRTRGLEVVLEDLASLGYDAEWATYRASDVGAPHRRDRMWILAYSPQVFRDGCGIDGREVSESRDCRLSPYAGSCHENAMGHTYQAHIQGVSKQSSRVPSALADADGAGSRWSFDPAEDAESPVGRVVDGLADPLLRWNRTHALAALGNGWVPQQAAEAFRRLYLRSTEP